MQGQDYPFLTPFCRQEGGLTDKLNRRGWVERRFRREPPGRNDYHMEAVVGRLLG